MIIEVEAGQLFDAPMGAHFNLRIRTPFTSGELSGAGAGNLLVLYTDPNGSTGSFECTAAGTDMMLEFTPAMGVLGLWELKPQATIAGKVRKFQKAVAMNMLADDVSTYTRFGKTQFQ